MTRLALGALACALLACAPALAAPPRYGGADELAAKIDRLMAAGWKKAAVTPAKPAGDAEWLRRVYLDLAGRIPSVTEARKFLDDKRPDKRQKLVESLLAGNRYPTYFASVWRELLIPEVNSNLNVRFGAAGFEGWLRKWLASERGYDWMARELITAPVSGGGPAAFRLGGGDGPGLFYSAKEFKPEELAGAASRLFLGVNLGCAQCHNHPFADWKKEQFWSFAAFFSGITSRRQGDFAFAEAEKPDRHEITIPNSEKVVKAKFLDGTRPEITSGMKARQVLADWMTAQDNPYFARAAVNRMWAHFFGTGLVEPLDEMAGTESVPSHPEVLKALAEGFARQKYDVRWLIRVITATRAYQLTSARSDASQDDPKQFAKAALRGLSGEQLYDSLARATGYQEGAAAGGRAAVFGGGGSRGEFLGKFASSTDRAVDAQTSILQALTLMNGRVMATATSLKQSETLAAIADAPFLDTAGKIEALYLAALSRPPTAKELSRMGRHVESAGAGRQGEALADVFWALLNSAEFVLNH